MEHDSSLITPTAEIGTQEGPSAEWLSTHRTTAQEQESAKWLEGRNQDVVADRALKQALGQSFETYRKQLESIESSERLDLIDKSPEEIAAHLDERASATREQKKLDEILAKQTKEQADATFAANETSELREVRRAMKAAYADAASLDARIAKLQRLNELRDDPTAKGWDDMPAEDWRAARDGKAESVDGEIANLLQEKQTKLQEAALHQSTYHEGTRASQISHLPPAPERPIGQISTPNGAMQITQADISALVQREMDEQSYRKQLTETQQRYPDWRESALAARDAGVDITPGQAAFIMSLPNGAEVAYYLVKNHAETRSLSQMHNVAAQRALINLSHKLSRQGAPAEPRKTSAPKPPSAVGGGASRGEFDASDESGSADEWMHRRNESLRRRGKI